MARRISPTLYRRIMSKKGYTAKIPDTYKSNPVIRVKKYKDSEWFAFMRDNAKKEKQLKDIPDAKIWSVLTSKRI